jgi:hypothetical protein
MNENKNFRFIFKTRKKSFAYNAAKIHRIKFSANKAINPAAIDVHMAEK